MQTSLVGQTLSARAQQHFHRAYGVVDAERDARIVPQIKLGNVAAKMTFTAVLIDTLKDQPAQDKLMRWLRLRARCEVRGD
jgi:hypothetical protein